MNGITADVRIQLLVVVDLRCASWPLYFSGYYWVDLLLILGRGKMDPWFHIILFTPHSAPTTQISQ